MPPDARETLLYKRNHFTTRLPQGYSYCLSHFWLRQAEPGRWRVGLTTFATRMLGDIVEFDFEVETGRPVQLAEVIGWIEGFKAVSDIFCVVAGVFGDVNPTAVNDPEVICRDPYGEGWLYSVDGTPDPGSVDVGGYVEHLDRTIDKMLEKPWKSGALNNP